MCGAADAGGVIESFCLTFTAGLPGIGEPVSAPLCNDGDDVAVTADNRREYVDAYVDCILNTSIEKQVRMLCLLQCCVRGAELLLFLCCP